MEPPRSFGGRRDGVVCISCLISGDAPLVMIADFICGRYVCEVGPPLACGASQLWLPVKTRLHLLGFRVRGMSEAWPWLLG